MTLRKKLLISAAALTLVLTGTVLAFHALSLKKSDIEAFLKEGNYTQDELLLFADLAFLEGRLCKWEEDIRVEIKDTNRLRAYQIEQVDSIVRIFSKLVAPLKIYRVESGGNLVVYRDIENPDFGGLGLCRSPYYKNKRICVIRQAQVYDVLGKGERVCLHEMLHAIGLQHPSRSYPFFMTISTGKTPYYATVDELDKIFSIRYYMSEQEKKVVRMMYSPHIKPGLTKEEFLKKTGLSEDYEREVVAKRPPERREPVRHSPANKEKEAPGKD